MHPPLRDGDRPSLSAPLRRRRSRRQGLHGVGAGPIMPATAPQRRCCEATSVACAAQRPLQPRANFSQPPPKLQHLPPPCALQYSLAAAGCCPGRSCRTLAAVLDAPVCALARLGTTLRLPTPAPQLPPRGSGAIAPWRAATRGGRAPARACSRDWWRARRGAA